MMLTKHPLIDTALKVLRRERYDDLVREFIIAITHSCDLVGSYLKICIERSRRIHVCTIIDLQIIEVLFEPEKAIETLVGGTTQRLRKSNMEKEFLNRVVLKDFRDLEGLDANTVF